VTTIYLVRHGATDWNVNKRAQGQADIPLNEEGKLQALHAARELEDVPVTAVYSSDLDRAFDTAAAIASAHGLEVHKEPAFQEIDQGDWEGLRVDEIRRRWPDMWGPARHYMPRPGGESPHQVRERALAGLARVLKDHPEGNVVVVSHGGTIRWMSAEVLGYDDHRSARIRGLGNGGIVSFDASLNNGTLKLANLKRLDGATPDLDDPND
jgi:broad specificity phosphatase PhoE